MVGWLVGWLLRYCIIDWIGFDCFMSLLYYDTTCSTKVKNKSTITTFISIISKKKFISITSIKDHPYIVIIIKTQ